MQCFFKLFDVVYSTGRALHNLIISVSWSSSMFMVYEADAHPLCEISRRTSHHEVNDMHTNNSSTF